MPTRISKKVQSRRGVSQPLLIPALVGCCLISIGTAVWNIRSSRPATTKAAPIVVGQFDAVELAVPAEVVPRGTRVGDISFRMIRYPAHQIPKGAIRDINSYQDWITTTELPSSLPLFPANLSKSRDSKNPVITQIPPGMRAMAVKVDATSAVEGWATSGSRVDILLVRSDNETTTVVAENVRVLSAERSVDPMSGDQTPHIPSTVTLLVDQTQCLAINTAIPLGTIRFALRNSTDGDKWVKNSFESSQLIRGRRDRSEAKISGYVTVRDKKGQPGKTFAVRDGGLVEMHKQQQSTPDHSTPQRIQ